MLLVEGFQKFAGIPFGISRIFKSLMPQQISANRRKNRSIQVLSRLKLMSFNWSITSVIVGRDFLSFFNISRIN